MELKPNSLDLNGNELEHALELEDMKRNPISIRGADYAHHITTCSPSFSDLPTALLPLLTAGINHHIIPKTFSCKSIINLKIL